MKTTTIGLCKDSCAARLYAMLLTIIIIITSASAQTSGTSFNITKLDITGSGATAVVAVTYSYVDPGARSFSVRLEASNDNGASWGSVPVQTVTGASSVDATSTTKSATLSWHAGADWAESVASSMRMRLVAIPLSSGSGDYLVIDLSGGPSATSYPVQTLSSLPVPVPEMYKTTRMVLRRIPAGSFAMHSPNNELGRDLDEAYHVVTFTNDHFVGIYEVTQRQYELVMGTNPSQYTGSNRPVEQVSWNDVRGGAWPNGGPATGSFMQRLQARAKLAVDLPTESLWEYACRAGTTTAFHNGKTIEANAESAALAEVGRYFYNRGSATHATVGSYQPNAWGLYDMHGNVAEWCLDWYGTYPGDVVNPTGPASGPGRSLRGGSWYYGAKYSRAAFRDSAKPALRTNIAGFRVALPATSN